MPIKKQASYEYFEIYVSDLCWEHMAHYIKRAGTICASIKQKIRTCVSDIHLVSWKKLVFFFTNGQSSDVYEDPWY